MKVLILIILTLSFFNSCTDSEIRKEDCKKTEKVLKVTKVLNFRTGKYEIKKECVNE